MIVSVLQNCDRAYEQYALLSFLAFSPPLCLDVVENRNKQEITVLLEKEVGCRQTALSQSVTSFFQS
jgi:hypothetical protein